MIESNLRHRNRLCPWKRLIAAALAFGLILPSVALAEVKAIELKTELTDFALNPETGDIAAIDAERGTAVLLPEKLLTEQSGELGAPVSIGPTPTSICFKRFGGKSYFAIVCFQDTYLTLLNAADLSRAAKIQTDCLGTSRVFCSRNPDDPFLYLMYRKEHEALGNAVDMRDMSSVGVVFNDALDGAVSANGQFAYWRNTGEPSKFNSRRLINSLADKKPEFRIGLQSAHINSSACLPDPTESYTATETVLRSADLLSHVAVFKFKIVGFSMTPPLIFGTSNSEGSGDKGVAKGITLHAASLNTFQPAGKPVMLPPKFGMSAKLQRKNVNGQPDPRLVVPKTRYLFDDQRKRLVCCSLNQMVAVPYSVFNAPLESLLHVALKSASTAWIGFDNNLSFEVADKSASLQFIKLPDGATADGETVKWTPRYDQMGSHVITARLKSGELERNQSFTIQVLNESLTLPFVVQQVILNSSGTFAFCWGQTPRHNGPAIAQQATVDIIGRKVLATRTEPLNIYQPLIDDRFVYLHEPGGSFVQIHDIATLDPIKTVNAEDAIEQLSIQRGQSLVALGRTHHTVFNLSNFSRSKLALSGSIEMAAIGPIWNDIVLDDTLEKTRLLLQLPKIGAIGQLHPGIRRGYAFNFLGEPRQIENVERDPRPAASTSPETYFRAVATTRQLQSAPGAPTTLTLTIQDWVRGTDLRKIPVAVRRFENQRDARPVNGLAVGTCPKLVVVVWEDQFYQFAMPNPLPSEFVTGISVRPGHSHLSLSEAKDGVLELPHVATGGVGRKTFTLNFAPTGISIDEKTGLVSIQSKIMTDRAIDALAASLKDSTADDPFSSLKVYQRQSNEQFVQSMRRNPAGVPISLLIRVRVQDEDSQISELGYAIIIETPLEAVMERLRKEHAARFPQEGDAKSKALAQTPAALPPQVGKIPTAPLISGQTEDLRKLREKVESLETRVDLLTRQLGELIKKLDPPKPDEK